MATVVLYEDRLSKDARSPNGYVPHQFLLCCVADRLGREPWSLKQDIKGIPLNGIGKLKAAMDDPGKYRPRGELLIFVADSDVIHHHFHIQRQAPEAMCQDILEKLEHKNGIQLHLLVENLESVVGAAAQALNRPIFDKSHITRDTILGALLDPSKASQRAQVVAQVAMLTEIVTALVQANS